MQYALVALAVIVSAVLSYVGNELPGEAWALVGLLVGAAVPTPAVHRKGRRRTSSRRR